MSVIGELLVEINGDNSGLKKSLSDSSNQMSSAINKMVAGISAAAIAWKGVDLAIKGIDYNAQAEQAEIAFGVLLKSAGAAKNMIEELRDLAKETPLRFDEVRDAGLKLKAFGVETEKIIPAMEMLADVSAGLQIPVKDLAYLFGSVKAQGKALTVDLMQFANRGIPIWTELTKVTGVQGTELKKMVEEGKIGFPQIEQAFKNMTSAGGDFFQMAEKQMDSFTGVQSNMNDTFDIFVGKATEGFMGPLSQGMKDLINIMTNAMGNIKTFGETLGTVLAGVVNTVNVLLAALSYVPGQLTAIGAAAGLAFLAFGPWGAAIAAAVVALAAVFDYTDKIANAVKYRAAEEKAAAQTLLASNQALNKQQSDAKKEQKKLIDDAKKATDELNAALAYRISIEEGIKQEYSNQLGLIANIIQSGKDKAKIEADAAAAKVISDAKEATGRQIALGYQNAAIANQIKAIGFEQQYQSELQKTTELILTMQALVQNFATAFQSVTAAVGASFAKMFAEQITGLTSLYNLEREKIENNGMTRKEALEKNLADAITLGDVKAQADAQKELDLYNLQSDFIKKKAQLEYEAAMVQWNIQVSNATASFGVALMNAVASAMTTGPFAMATLATYTAAVGSFAGLISTVANAQPKAPAFADGGIVGGNSFSGDNINARVNSGEMILNMDDQRNLFRMIKDGGPSSKSPTIQIYLDSRVIAESTVNLVDNGVVKMRSLAR